MVCDGFSAVSADWNTIWMRRSSSRLRCASVGWQRAAVELHRARAGRQQPGDDARQRRLARARFADHADRLAALELEVDVLEDRHRPACRRASARAVAGRRALHAQQHVGVAGARRAGAARRRACRGEQALACSRSAARPSSRSVAPTSRMRPSRSTRMWSAICATTARSWLTYTAVDLALAHHAAEGAQHLDLRGHVERRGRLVEDHDLGVGDQRHRRHQPLQLPARDLVRVALADGLRVRQRQLAEQRDRLQLGFARAAAVPWMTRRLDHLVHDRARRVERGRRALRDVGDGAAAQRAQLPRVAAPARRRRRCARCRR